MSQLFKVVVTRALLAGRRVLLLSVLGAVVTLSSIADTAWATDYCNKYGHNTYAQACLFGNNFSAAEATLEASDLTLAGSDWGDHVINGLWVANGDSGDPHWMEAGMLRGTLCTVGTGNVAITDPNNPNRFTCTGSDTAEYAIRFYWGEDKSSCECYSFHVDTSDAASLNTPYNAYIYRLDSQHWVADMGPTGGTSGTAAYPNTLTPDEIRTGIEETSTEFGRACAEQYNLTYWDSAGTQHDGWGSSTLVSESPTQAWWVNTDHWAREWSGNTTSSCYGR